MKITKAHGTDKASAKAKVEGLIPALVERFGEAAMSEKPEWQEDTMSFDVEAQGMNITGTIEVDETSVNLEIKLPMLVRAFEGRIRAGVERRLDKMFAT